MTETYPENLPVKLRTEPLVDAIFEIRFEANVPASDVLPGYLYSNLDGEKSLQRLVPANLPQAIRDSEPNLKYAPMVRVVWNDYAISIGDRGVTIACKMPYPGWDEFKKVISLLLDEVEKSGVVKEVERFSVKYINILKAAGIEDQISLIRSDINIGGHNVSKDPFQLRLEKRAGEVINIITIATSAKASLRNGGSIEGIVLDIDTIFSFDVNRVDFLSGILEKIDAVRLENKKTFFACLKEETINSLGPIYE